MTEDFKLPPAKTLEEANAQRDAWVTSAAEFSQRADYYRGLLDKIGAILGDTVRTLYDGEVLPENQYLYPMIPEAVETMIAGVAEFGKKHLSILSELYTALNMYPGDENHARHNLIGARTTIQHKGITSNSKDTINRVIEQIEAVEGILIDSLVDCGIPLGAITPQIQESLKADNINLKILCRIVDGQLQIGYMRDAAGTERNFTENGGIEAFYLVVEIDKAVLSQKIPEIKARIQKGI